MGTKLKCLNCMSEIESTYRHDFKFCECEKCFVDGGNEYGRYGYDDPSLVEIYDKTTDSWINLAQLHKLRDDTITHSQTPQRTKASHEVIDAVILDWFNTHENITTLQLKNRLRELGFEAVQEDVSIQLNEFYLRNESNMDITYGSNENVETYRVYTWITTNSILNEKSYIKNKMKKEN